MPFTPFHFGPGGALHVAAPRHVSFLAFVAANVLTDVEPGYYMLTGQFPLHRFLHTLVGASLVTVLTAALFLLALRAAAAVRLPNPFGWQQLRPLQVLLGAAAGAFSHIVLDGVMHDDMRPLAPFSDTNPLYRVISLGALHQLCLAAGALALAGLALRWWLQRRRRAR